MLKLANAALIQYRRLQKQQSVLVSLEAANQRSGVLGVVKRSPPEEPGLVLKMFQPQVMQVACTS